MCRYGVWYGVFSKRTCVETVNNLAIELMCVFFFSSIEHCSHDFPLHVKSKWVEMKRMCSIEN